MKIIIIL